MKRYVFNSVQMLLIWFGLFMLATLLWRLFAPLLLVFLAFWLIRRLWQGVLGLFGMARTRSRQNGPSSRREYRPDKMVIDVEGTPADPEDGNSSRFANHN